jgi:transposase
MEETACPGCRELLRRVAELEALVRELRDRLNRNASNSSLPPSANPPAAPKPVVKPKTGRRPGGQPGHPPHLKQLLPPPRVTTTTAYVPEYCERCRGRLPAQAAAADPPPSRFQVVDLPDVAAVVHEHQGHARACPGCGHVTRASVPAAVRAHSVGPGLTATLAYLTGCHGLSKRAAEEVSAAVFAAPVALGTLSRLEQEVSAALAPAHRDALAAVRAAPVKHADETGWKLAGKLRWLWGAATQSVAVFLVHAGRGTAALAALLGQSIEGLLHSDRWHAYQVLPEQRRQLCWAHLKRDFRKWQERGGAGAELGREGLRAARHVFRAWHLFRGGGCTRVQLQERLAPVRRRLTRVLVAGEFGADARLARFCAHLVAWEESLWRFAAVEGAEPTNNHMERLLRRAVLWRRRSFGCQSEAGCRYVERILTAVQTLRLQERRVLEFLRQALTAHRHGLPTPQLLQDG